MESQTSKRGALGGDGLILAALVIAKLLIHALTAGRYGYFIDELYYVACSDHLDFGYVDHPPLSIALLYMTRLVLGSSLLAMRLVPAVVGAATIVVTVLIARELGGGRFARFLAGLTALIAPIYLALSNYYSMNAYDVFFWALAAYVLIRLLRTDNPKLWLVFGAIAGVALLNKISIGFFGFGVVVGLLLTQQRKQFLSKWIWLGALLAFVIFLPHIIWQIQHDWPTAEFIHNAKTFKNNPMSALEFLKAQVLLAHPLCLPVWLAGLAWYLFARAARPYRVLGWAYIAVCILLIVQNGKSYYLGASYSMLLAAGALAIERLIQQRNWTWVRPVLTVVLIAGGALFAPFTVPVLPPDQFVSYATAIGIEAPKDERRAVAELPQHFADRFGWQEMVRAVAGVYDTLSPAEQAECVIFCSSYGRAGAIDLFGPDYGLPKACSGHNSYFLWGPPKRSGQVTIAVGVSHEELESIFEEVTYVAESTHRYAMPSSRNQRIYLCRKPRKSIQELWPQTKNFI